jgi:hypothetical protein
MRESIRIKMSLSHHINAISNGIDTLIVEQHVAEEVAHLQVPLVVVGKIIGFCACNNHDAFAVIHDQK